MPVCILGMPASGGALVAQLLQRCGLDLGPAEELAPPDGAVPGAFENVCFARLNHLILHGFGGAWDAPPAFPARWETDAVLAHAGDLLVTRFRWREPWGWKDPTASLTLRFWQRIAPTLRVVVCVRNPLAVARSLAARRGLSIAHGLDLWRAYHLRILHDARPTRVVTCFERYLDDPEPELTRVLAALRLPAPPAVRAAAATLVEPARRQAVADLADLRDAGVDPAVLRLYRRLVVDAGPPSHQGPRGRATPAPG